jgi:FixJ family two-component response regulator
MRLSRLFHDSNLGALVHAAETDAAERIGRLTPMQRKILDGIVDGHPNKVIAHKLGLSQRTVENYRAEIRDRVEVSSALGLARLLILAGE